MKNVSMIKVEDLERMTQEVRERWPNADLVKNLVGNLAVYVGDEYVGYMDLKFAEVCDLKAKD